MSTFFRARLALFLVAAMVLVNGCAGGNFGLNGLGSENAPAAVATAPVFLHDGEAFDLTASAVTQVIDGKAVQMLAYNGSIPGPEIHVDQGATVTLKLHNKLSNPTTLHSHGLRLANAFDGVPGVTQPEIGPGKSFDYTLTFPDAGVFWYHPHLREDRDQELGLYGNFVVAAKNDPNWNPVDRELALFVDDLLLVDGQVASYGEQANHVLMGRYGNTFLVNGQTDAQFPVQKDEILRLYLTNAANARPFKLSIPGARVKLVGSDNGLYERETWADSVILGPSERAILEVSFEKTGDFVLRHSTPEQNRTLAHFVVTDSSALNPAARSAFEVLHEHADLVAEMDRLRATLPDAPAHQVLMTLNLDGMGDMNGMAMGDHSGHDMGSMGGMSSMNEAGGMGGSNMDMAASPDGIEWEDTMSMMNASSTPDTVKWILRDQTAGAGDAENMDIHWSFKKGDLVKLRFVNDKDSPHAMQHPLHFHGQRFVVLSLDGVPTQNMAWKDTVLIPSGSTVDLLLEASNLGEWMAHCHIPEHLESGMMLNFSVL